MRAATASSNIFRVKEHKLRVSHIREFHHTVGDRQEALVYMIVNSTHV